MALEIGTVSDILYVNISEPYYFFMLTDPDGNLLEITGANSAPTSSPEKSEENEVPSKEQSISITNLEDALEKEKAAFSEKLALEKEKAALEKEIALAKEAEMSTTPRFRYRFGKNLPTECARHPRKKRRPPHPLQQKKKSQPKRKKSKMIFSHPKQQTSLPYQNSL